LNNFIVFVITFTFTQTASMQSESATLYLLTVEDFIDVTVIFSCLQDATPIKLFKVFEVF